MWKIMLVAGILVIGTIAYVVVSPSISSHATTEHNHSDSVTVESEMVPLEPGQSGFAAIAEIVAILRNDPKTEWKNVDIDALREHLVDMNELTLNTKVSKSQKDGEIQFRITGHGNTLRAVQSMVPAHAKQLAADLGWNTITRKIENGIILTIASSDKIRLHQLSALGFFGIMATGAHHQQHHLQMAKGESHIH